MTGTNRNHVTSVSGKDDPMPEDRGSAEDSPPVTVDLRIVGLDDETAGFDAPLDDAPLDDAPAVVEDPAENPADLDLRVVGLDDETAGFDEPLTPNGGSDDRAIESPLDGASDLEPMDGSAIDPAERGLDGASDGAPIPAEEWLARAVTVTAEIQRTVANDNPVTGQMKARSTMPRTPHDRRNPPAVITRNGSMTRERDNLNDPDRREIVGAFTPVASVASRPTVDVRHRGRDDDGRVVIGIIQTGSDEGLSRPEPIAHANPLSGRRIVSLVMLVLALVGLGGGTGYLLAGYLPERWTAEAEIVVDSGTAQPDRYLATQQVLMQSSVVLEQVAADLPIDRKGIEEELKVFPVEASSALGITFVDSDPELARSVVDAVVAAFMNELSEAAVDETADLYVERLDAMNEQRQMIEQRLAVIESANSQAEAEEKPIPYPGEARRLGLESEQLLSQIITLEQALLDEQVGEIQRTDAVVVTEPRLLPEPTWPKPLALAALGMLTGAVMAGLVLFLLAAYTSPTGEDRVSGGTV